MPERFGDRDRDAEKLEYLTVAMLAGWAPKDSTLRSGMLTIHAGFPAAS
jgi:hypothetical protein